MSLVEPGHFEAGKIPLKLTDIHRQLFQADPNITLLAYNPSPLFERTHRMVRVDASNGRTVSLICEETPNGLIPYVERVFGLEDPSVTYIGNELIFTGVNVDMSKDPQGNPVSKWRTDFYRGNNINEVRKFFVGPEGMKDIRLVELTSGRVGVYTRPREPGNEALGGDGQIGYREFNSIDELEKSPRSVLEIGNAPLIPYRFKDGKWGGVNQAQIVMDKNGRIWTHLLIHEAYKDDQGRHYKAMHLLHDPRTNEIVDLGILAQRSDFPPGAFKSKDYWDLVFPSEIIFEEEILTLIAGLSDAEMGIIKLPNTYGLRSVNIHLAVAA